MAKGVILGDMIVLVASLIGLNLSLNRSRDLPNLKLDEEIGQAFSIDRASAAYRPSHKYKPSQILSSGSFGSLLGRHYVTVEGWICYVATGTPRYSNLPGLEADWDVHFGLIDTVPPAGVDVNAAYRKTHALTCEITPTARLSMTSALMDIHNTSKTTYRKVRVRGYLRLGSEQNHEGTADYLYNGFTLKNGHWEIHPVESVESIDSGTHFTIGPNAIYALVPPADRYKLGWSKWSYSPTNQNQNTTNHGALKGRVTSMAVAADGSGDIELALTRDDGSSGLQMATLAVIPEYYVQHFDVAAHQLTLRPGTIGNLPNPIQLGALVTLSGLRSWRFGPSGPPSPVMDPVEKIEG